MKVLTALTNRLGNRSSNQDRCLVLEKPDRVLLAVADGMGGHDRGDLAAQTAVDSLGHSFLNQRENIADPKDFLKRAMEMAHLETVEAGRHRTPSIQPRTTCVVCLIEGNQAWWAHVGDSRLYLLRAGSLVTRTRDHTPVEELLRHGIIAEHELSSHPLRNSVSRCLGGTPRIPEISIDHAELRPNDTLLLCSDGLWSALPEQRLLDLPMSGNLESAINALSEEAETASYPQSDNVTLVGLRWLSAAVSQRVDDAADAERRANTAPSTTKDPLEQAIDDINRAILDYAWEMKK